MKSFVEAVDYVNLNQSMWNQMIERCYTEWVRETSPIANDFTAFDQYVSTKYGIRIDPLIYNSFNYQVVDRKKYMFFQMTFA